MRTYYFAALVAALILGTTLLITSWGFIEIKIKSIMTGLLSWIKINTNHLKYNKKAILMAENYRSEKLRPKDRV
jgi:hypothetical protein